MFAKKNKPTPCHGCEHEPPEMDYRLMLFDEVYGPIQGCINGEGDFQYEVLFRVMELMNLTPEQQGRMIEMTALVEGLRRNRVHDLLERERAKCRR